MFLKEKGAVGHLESVQVSFCCHMGRGTLLVFAEQEPDMVTPCNV